MNNSINPMQGIKCPYNSVAALQPPLKFWPVGDEDNNLYGFDVLWLVRYGFISPDADSARDDYYPVHLAIEGMEFEFQNLDLEFLLAVYRRTK